MCSRDCKGLQLLGIERRDLCEALWLLRRLTFYELAQTSPGLSSMVSLTASPCARRPLSVACLKAPVPSVALHFNEVKGRSEETRRGHAGTDSDLGWLQQVLRRDFSFAALLASWNSVCSNCRGHDRLAPGLRLVSCRAG